MSFDLLAPHYRWMEAVLAGNKLQRCRTHWLDSVTHCRNALLVGEGNGRFLAECANRLPETQLTVLDASTKMLKQAEQRWRNARGDARAKFVQAKLPGLNLPSHAYDLIVTNCFLDCFGPEQLPQVITDLSTCATDSAIWLITDFAIPQNGWPKWRAKAVLHAAYMFFRITTNIRAKAICPPDRLVAEAGFELKGRIEADAGLLYSAMWQRTKNPNHATHMAAPHHDSTGTTCALPKATATLRA
jgi:ubiquinone/menaquinone biosynthesis C-methylase UbiE